MEIFNENKSQSIINNEKVQSFIEDREIKPEHFYIIEKLATFDKNEIIGSFHNFFTLNAHNSLRELENGIRFAKEDGNTEREEIYKLFLEFFKNYDEYASHHLARVLEAL